MLNNNVSTKMSIRIYQNLSYTKLENQMNYVEIKAISAFGIKCLITSNDAFILGFGMASTTNTK